MADLTIEIITPAEIIYKGEADSVMLPGSKAPFQVLKNHVPIVSSLDSGKIKLSGANGEKLFQNSEGFAEISNNKVSVLVESAQEL